MPTKKCCKCGSCLIGKDDFNRANENPVSGSWSEISGDWEVLSNQLNCITEGPLVTTLRQPPPRRAGKGYNTRIVVDLVIPASGGASWKIITGYRGTGDYDHIELTYNGTTGEMLPKFYKAGSLVMDITTNPAGEAWFPDPGTNFKMQICCAHVEWGISAVGIQGDVIWQNCEDGGLAALPTAPLGGVGFLFGKFDNWEYYIHWESNFACLTCQCFCVDPTDGDDYKCIPEQLTLTLSDDSAGLTCSIDFMTLTMYLSEPDVSGATPVYDLSSNRKLWYSDTFMVETEEMWFILVCDSDHPLTLSLVPYPILDASDESTTNLFCSAFTLPDSASCNPIIFVYTNAISTGVITCDVLDEFGVPIGTGTRPIPCSECFATGTPSPTWTVTITE